jgi:hypothetical protein
MGQHRTVTQGSVTTTITPRTDENGKLCGNTWTTTETTPRGSIHETKIEKDPNGKEESRTETWSGRDGKGHNRVQTEYTEPGVQKRTETSETWNSNGRSFEIITVEGQEGRYERITEKWTDAKGQQHEKITEHYQWSTSEGDFDSKTITHTWVSPNGEYHQERTEKNTLTTGDGKTQHLPPDDPRVEKGRAGENKVEPSPHSYNTPTDLKDRPASQSNTGDPPDDPDLAGSVITTGPSVPADPPDDPDLAGSVITTGPFVPADPPDDPDLAASNDDNFQPADPPDDPDIAASNDDNFQGDGSLDDHSGQSGSGYDNNDLQDDSPSDFG